MIEMDNFTAETNSMKTVPSSAFNCNEQLKQKSFYNVEKYNINLNNLHNIKMDYYLMTQIFLFLGDYGILMQSKLCHQTLHFIKKHLDLLIENIKYKIRYKTADKLHIILSNTNSEYYNTIIFIDIYSEYIQDIFDIWSRYYKQAYMNDKSFENLFITYYKRRNLYFNYTTERLKLGTIQHMKSCSKLVYAIL